MSNPDEGANHRIGRTTSRRRFLAAAAGVTVGAVAGCTGAASREFEADSVVLPAGAREELTLAETARDSVTSTRVLDGVDIDATATRVEAAVTSQIAAYARGPARGQPTLIEKFVGQVNGTEGAGSAVVALASDLGVEEVTISREVLEPAESADAPVTVAGDQVSLVVPAGAREGEATTEDVMVLVPGDAVFVNQTHFTVNQTHFATGAPEFLPSSVWTTYESASWTPSERWTPGTEGTLDEDITVLVAPGEVGRGNGPEELFGVPEAEMPGERVGEGESYDGINPMIFGAPADVALTDDTPFAGGVGEGGWLDELFDRGRPAPLGGATFGLGVLSTPTDSVDGQSVNPLPDDERGLLEDERVGEMLKQAGLTDAEEVDLHEIGEGGWLVGPEEVGDVPDGTEFSAVTMVDETAEPRTFGGVVEGENHPWFVLVTLARAAPDDVVVAAGVQRSPLATRGNNGDLDAYDTGNNPFLTRGNNGDLDAYDTGNNPFLTRGNNGDLEASTGNNPFLKWHANAVELSSVASGRLGVGEPDT